MRKPRVLVVDDGTVYASLITERMPEFEVVDPEDLGRDMRLEDGAAALDFLDKNREKVDVLLLDMHFDLPEERLFELGEGASPRRTRRFQGIAILRQVRRRYPELPVVLLTASPDLSLVEAADELKSQSMTYFTGSDDIDALRIRINAAWQEASAGIEDSRVLWGSSAQMRAVRRRLSVLARGRMPVIIEGETGTGKSFLAERFVHVNSGRGGPFVVCDLSTVPKELIPAHLFGAVRGAYTGAVADRKGLFELAHKGTLFIDEIQNIPLDAQRQLLQVLQERRVRPLGAAREIQVDVKVVAASNMPLDAAVASGKFRPDLYMRLSPATRVRIVPLRERPADLEFLARRFVEQAARDADVEDLTGQVAEAIGLPLDVAVTLEVGPRDNRKRPPRHLELALPEPAWQMILEHKWPGNVRELQNVMQNIVVFTLVAAVDAVREGMPIRSTRLQVDPGLVGELLSGSAMLSGTGGEHGAGQQLEQDEAVIRITPGQTLNAVANSVEKQYFLHLYKTTGGDFRTMARLLLADENKGRAIRLRFNQLGLKVREISG